MTTTTYRMSFAELVAAAKAAPADDRSEGRNQRASDDWDLGIGFAGALKLAERGWTEGTSMVDAMSMRFADQLVTKLKMEQWTKDVTGIEIDVATYLNGEPECWFASEERDVELTAPGAGVVHLVMCGSASSGIDAAVMQRKGAAAAALAMLLERAGRPVAIDVAYTATKGDHNLVTIATVKEPGEALDVDRIAFALTHPACFRRVVFAAWESLPESVRRTFGFHRGGGYGHPRDVVAPEDRGDIYLPPAHWDDSHWHSEASAVAWVADYLRRYGVLND